MSIFLSNLQCEDMRLLSLFHKRDGIRPGFKMAKPFLTCINSRTEGLSVLEKKSRSLMKVFNAIGIPQREIANAFNETIRKSPGALCVGMRFTFTERCELIKTGSS